MTVSSALFSSAVSEWETPPDLFRALDAEFHFTLDAAASVANAKCPRYYTIEDNALVQRWDGVVFLNPPYGRGVGTWVAKAHAEALRGATVVVLIAARTDTAWFHDHVLGQAEVRFIRGRLHFVGAAGPAPFPSMIVVFRPDGSGPYPVTSWTRPAEAP